MYLILKMTRCCTVNKYLAICIQQFQIDGPVRNPIQPENHPDPHLLIGIQIVGQQHLENRRLSQATTKRTTYMFQKLHHFLLGQPFPRTLPRPVPEGQRSKPMVRLRRIPQPSLRPVRIRLLEVFFQARSHRRTRHHHRLKLSQFCPGRFL